MTNAFYGIPNVLSRDENIVRVEQDDTKSDEERDTTAGTSNNSVNSNAVNIVEPSSPSASGTMRLNSQDTTSPLKHPVQRPAKTADQLEKEYIENVAALTDLDKENWLEAIALLKMEHSQNVLNQAEQRTVAIIDEYYASLREEQARREAKRIDERKEERKRAAIFAGRIHRWNEVNRLYEKKYIVEIEEQVQKQCNSINTLLQSAGNPIFLSTCAIRHL